MYLLPPERQAITFRQLDPGLTSPGPQFRHPTGGLSDDADAEGPATAAAAPCLVRRRPPPRRCMVGKVPVLAPGCVRADLGDCLGTAGDFEPGECVFEVLAHGARREPDLAGDHGIALACRDKPEKFALARC
jgi:hypothetical protein